MQNLKFRVPAWALLLVLSVRAGAVEPRPFDSSGAKNSVVSTATKHSNQDCLKQLSLADLQVLSQFEKTLSAEVDLLFRGALQNRDHPARLAVGKLRQAGANLDSQGRLQLQNFQFEKLSSDSALRASFLKVFPSAKNRIAQIADPKRKEAILIEGWALLPPYLKVAAPGQKFTAAMPLEKYHAILVSELRHLDQAFRDYLAASRSGGTMGDLIREVSAYWTHEAWNGARWEREHEAEQRSASAAMQLHLERLVQKWGLRGEQMYQLLSAWAGVHARAAENRLLVEGELLEKVIATTVAPLLVPIAAMGWLPAVGVGLALTAADAGLTARGNVQERGGAWACHLAQQLDRKFPQGFLMSLAFAPVSGLTHATHSTARVLQVVPVKTLAKSGLVALSVAGGKQALDSIHHAKSTEKLTQQVEKDSGKKSEVASAARAETREAHLHAVADTALAFIPLMEVFRPNGVSSPLRPRPFNSGANPATRAGATTPSEAVNVAPVDKVPAPAPKAASPVRTQGGNSSPSQAQPLDSSEAVQGIEALMRKFASGVEVDFSDPDQALMFDYYRRSLFGNPDTKLGTRPVQAVLEVLQKYPELAKKQPFRDVHWSSDETRAPVPETLRRFVHDSLVAARTNIGKFYNVEANIGFWRKILQLDGDLLEVLTPTARRILVDDSNSPGIRARLLFEILTKRRHELLKQGKDVRAISRVMVNVVHTVAYLDPRVLKRLNSDEGRVVNEGLRKVLEVRDELAMVLGFPDHFPEVLRTLGVDNPDGIPSEKKLRESLLSQFSEEVEKGAIVVRGAGPRARTIRQLSVSESPFRSCVGGSDCSSRTYLTRALDPNYHYFTMTDPAGYSQGQITIVLGEGKVGHRSVQVAFIDKLQSVPDSDLPHFLEGIRQSVADQGYVLALPRDLGGHNGISNYTETTRFLATRVPVDHAQLIEGYRPNPHPRPYSLDSSYSRADKRLPMNPILPLASDRAAALRLGALPDRSVLRSGEASHHSGNLRSLKHGDERSKLLYMADFPNDLISKFDPLYSETLVGWLKDPGESLKVRKRAFFQLVRTGVTLKNRNLTSLLTTKEQTEILDQCLAEYTVFPDGLVPELAALVQIPELPWVLRKRALLRLFREEMYSSPILEIFESLDTERLADVTGTFVDLIDRDSLLALRARQMNPNIRGEWSYDFLTNGLHALLIGARRVPQVREEAARIYLQYSRLILNESFLGSIDSRIPSWRENLLTTDDLYRILDRPTLDAFEMRQALVALHEARRPLNSERLLDSYTLALKLKAKDPELTQELLSEVVQSARAGNRPPAFLTDFVVQLLASGTDSGRAVAVRVLEGVPEIRDSDSHFAVRADALAISRAFLEKSRWGVSMDILDVAIRHFAERGDLEGAQRFFEERKEQRFFVLNRRRVEGGLQKLAKKLK